MNDYINLSVNGKEYALCFRVGMIRILKKQFGHDIIQLCGDLKDLGTIAGYMPEMIYSARACYCSIEKQPMDFTIEDITSWIDGLDPAKFNPIVNLVLNAILKPLVGLTGASQPEGEATGEPFPVDGHREVMPGADDDAPLGAGFVHVERPVYENTGVR